MADILVLAETEGSEVVEATLEALTAVRSLDGDVHVLLVGDAVDADDAAEQLGAYGADTVHVAESDILNTFGPEAWGQALASAIEELSPDVVVASGTSKGNEVLAHAAARLGLPFVANCTVLPAQLADDDEVELTRIQWGGSLLEEARLAAETRIVSIGHHAVEAEASGGPAADVETIDMAIDADLARTQAVGREMAEAGVTLATAPIVFGGGRAVGSAEAFAPLEELASLMGGRVGCSRAVTNNGWRPHRDQVGQTGTRIAPELYVASGISGAIQHWVGAMASKKILAINTDPEANMVTKADYFVEGDLHKVLPAVADEIKRRRS
ncbi:MAG: electron transfer flavoprotein subunit alpha/FixB family protein [Acidimicrobiales bacterium]|nr:electron transfer flavoprotein subunit alpha/FixB family protein [Acidimicrobiales bacterium]